MPRKRVELAWLNVLRSAGSSFSVSPTETSAGFEEFLAADRGDRERRFKVRTADARAGDDDLRCRSGPVSAFWPEFDFLLARQRLGRILRLFGLRLLRKSRIVKATARPKSQPSEARSPEQTLLMSCIYPRDCPKSRPLFIAVH